MKPPNFIVGLFLVLVSLKKKIRQKYRDRYRVQCLLCDALVMCMRLIVLGPPGAGKETQATELSKRLGIAHVSVEKLLRAAIESGTLLGRRAKAFVEAGELIPDEVMIELVGHRLADSELEKGWVLDGYPRSLAQAKTLERWLKERRMSEIRVLRLKVMTGLLISRLLAAKREGDTVAVIRQRLKAYEEESAPLLEHYRKRGCLVSVNASGKVLEVAREVEIALAQYANESFGKGVGGKARFIATEEEFDALLADERPLVVDCTATWCGPCKLVAPLIDRLAGEYEGRVNVFKLDVDENKAVATRFEVKGVPAVMFFKGGELLETIAGAHPYERFAEMVTGFML